MHSTLTAQTLTPKVEKRNVVPQVILAAALTTTFAALTPEAKNPQVPMMFATGCGILTMGLVIGRTQEGRTPKPREL